MCVVFLIHEACLVILLCKYFHRVVIHLLEIIFGNDPRVRVINYFLVMKGESLNKKQITLGSEVAESTLNSFFDDLLESDIIVECDNLYRLNEDSRLVEVLGETQIKLATELFNQEEKAYLPEKRLSDEELDEIFDEEYEFDIDDELKKLEYIDSVNTSIYATE